MAFELIAQQESDVTDVSKFYKAVDIWLRNPHVVNRRILTCVDILIAEIEQNILDEFSRINYFKTLCQELHLCKQNELYDARNLLDILNITEYRLLDSVYDTLKLCDAKFYLFIRKLLPRNTEIFSPTLEFIFIDRRSNRVGTVTIFHSPIVPNKQSLDSNRNYRIRYNENGVISLYIQALSNDCDSTIEWLKYKFLPRFIKWMQPMQQTNSNLKVNSLSLIPSEKYALLYDELKKKYGKKITDIWCENTDPLKFVYEDIAIATYLLLIWEKERQERGIEKLQSFVDLGCGNGLLVYILSNEGHEGMGIDLRKRKIWELFPNNTNLKIRTVIPSASSLFPNADWLIGNHSDELTPWIPVIAARSSYSCRFFLLPCCCYEFDGRKYQRCDATRSQYADYIYYVKSICEGCGFDTQIDRLRIPSTKRTCLIGWKRTYTEENGEKQDKVIEGMIQARSQENTKNADGGWTQNFKARDPIEKARNCTQLDKTLISNIIAIVTSHLLHQGERIPASDPSKTWNAGRRVELGKIIQLIAPEMRQQMRKEFGGLQTLLKNHGHIFCVNQGKVQLRRPGTTTGKKGRNNSILPRRVKPCWFHNNHPDGCPVGESECNFKH